jgi:hypothetical protein
MKNMLYERLAKLFQMWCFSDLQLLKQVEKKPLFLHLFWEKSPGLYTSVRKFVIGMV